MALAIFLISGLVQGVVSSKTTFNSINAQTELQQNGRAALYFLEKEILKAGYVNELNVATRFDQTRLQEVWPKRDDIFEQTGVFISGTINDTTITSAQKLNTDAIALRYKVIDASVSIRACGGADISDPDITEVVVTFYVSTQNELNCKYVAYRSNGNVVDSTVRSILIGIEDLRIQYGIADTTTMPPKVNQYLSTASVESAGKWSEVIGVSLSLLVTSDSNLGAETVNQNIPSSYDLQGITVNVSNDGKRRQVFTTTQGLRNRL